MSLKEKLEARKTRIEAIKQEIEMEENNRKLLSEQYHNEIMNRGEDLRTWPMDVIYKFRSIAPYIEFGIEIPANFVSKAESDEPVAINTEFIFDPTKGFSPVITEEPKLVSPFSFNKNISKEEKPKRGEGISDSDYEKLESLFGDYLKDKKYRYEKFEGIFKLFITRVNEVEECYIIDNGSVLGGSTFAVLANKSDNDNVFVAADDPEIPNILSSKFYIVPDACAKMNEKRLFKFDTTNIYRYIDFSNTAWLDGTDVDKNLLEADLLGVINITSNIGESPRMRFAKFISADNFILVSDGDTKSPLVDIGATSGNIVNGFKVVFDKTKFSIYVNDNFIGQYNVTVQK